MKLQFIISTSTNPYLNVSVENYILQQPLKDTVTLYLWKNHRTVVIGQNQNPYSECNVNLLEEAGGYVMRRKTGGGAVYHDDGNINFSFIASHDLYDQNRQFSVIKRAVQTYGLEIELSGRNDILCQGRKFSGNAFSKGRYQNLHHGTILIKGNMEDLQRYLKVKPAKLQKHGVKSVQSRVINLSELAPVTSENIVDPLHLAFEQEYGDTAQILDYDTIIKIPEVQTLYNEFSSDEWLFAKWRNFNTHQVAQFPWGNVEISIDIDQQRQIINHIEIATDALDVDLVAQAKIFFEGADIHYPPETDNVFLKDMISIIYN